MLPRSVVYAILLFGILLLTGCNNTPIPEPTSIPAPTSTPIPERIATPVSESTITLPSEEEATKGKGPIVVGSRDFTEQLVLGQIIIARLEDAGYEMVDKTGLGGTNTAHDALKNGEVDIIWEYIGTILSESHQVPPNSLPTNVEVALDMVSALDARHYNLVWLEPTAFNDNYTLMIKPGTVADGIVTIEDLANFMNEYNAPLKLCVENEFYSRSDGLSPLQQHYNFAFKEENIEIVSYDHLYEGLRDGFCDVAEGFNTDGRINAWGFQKLVDSKQFFPIYQASPIIRQEVLDQYPELADLLNNIGSYLDHKTMTQLNARVDLGYDGIRNNGDEKSPYAVARDFLIKAGVIGERPKMAVGSRDFTEQLVLGQILITLLEDAGFDVVDKTGLGGTNTAHDALKNGEVDVIWEYIGTILSESHNVPSNGLPTDVKTGFNMVSALDKRHHNLVWLEPTPFNDTYTLMIKPGTLPKEIVTIEDLATYMNQNGSPLTLCVENEFYSRGDGLFPLQSHYGFAFKEENIQLVAYDQLYEGLRDGVCDVAEGFSTDGRIGAWGFQNLIDSKHFFPTYNASPVIRQETLNEHLELKVILDNVVSYLDDEIITLLNARVDVGADGVRNSGDEASPEEVARDFLLKTGLIGDRPQLVVGSRDLTQQLLLAQISIVLLEEAGYIVVEKTDLGRTKSAYNALNQGEIDLIWEYTDKALSEYHQIPPADLPTDPDEAWQQIAALDDPLGLVWLTPGRFNDTYTLMVKPGSVPAEVKSIEDLATYINKNDVSLKLCVENEFYSRGNGLFALQKQYEFAFKEENIEIVAVDQLYEGLRDGICDVAQGFSTDGRITAWDFQNLIDSKQFFPGYNAAPIVRKQALIAQPQIADMFEKVGPYLDNDTITRLNQRIDIGADGERNSGDEESIRTVAELFLCEVGLIQSRCAEITFASADETTEPSQPETSTDSDAEGEAASADETTQGSDQEAASDQEDASGEGEASSDQEAASAEEIVRVCENIIVNGDFESDTAWVLSAGLIPANYSTEQTHKGQFAVRLGTTEQNLAGHSTVNHKVRLPENATSATLTFWYYPISQDLVGGDQQGALIYDGSFIFVRQQLFKDLSNEQKWVRQVADLSAYIGEEINLHFFVINDGDPVGTAMYLDDVSLDVCYESE